MMKNKQYKVEGENFTKNPVRASIVNTNRQAYRSRLNKVAVSKRHQQELQDMKDEIKSLKELVVKLAGK